MCLIKIEKMDSTIGFDLTMIVVGAIRGRCASFIILTATVSEIFGGQTNSSIFVVGLDFTCVLGLDVGSA